MNRRQRRTLERVFEVPTRSDVEWVEVRSLLSACGGEIWTGKGSRVRVSRGESILSLHAPHEKELKKYAVELVRDFLVNAGVEP